MDSQTIGGPVTIPTDGTTTGTIDPPTGSSGETPSTNDPASGEVGGSDVGTTGGNFTSENPALILDFQSVGTVDGTGASSTGLYTPVTWWYGVVGVCVNVCR